MELFWIVISVVLFGLAMVALHFIYFRKKSSGGKIKFKPESDGFSLILHPSLGNGTYLFFTLSQYTSRLSIYLNQVGKDDLRLVNYSYPERNGVDQLINESLNTTMVRKGLKLYCINPSSVMDEDTQETADKLIRDTLEELNFEDYLQKWKAMPAPDPLRHYR